jgi:predicted NAD/FAD-binding protein
VEVFERDPRAGGHAHTVERDGLLLDTGFLVHNEPNYPLFRRLLTELGVAARSTDMSFSVSCAGCGLEWAGRRPFAQRRRLADARHWSLLREVARWLRTAAGTVDGLDERTTLGAYADEQGYSARFRRHFLVPLTAALWSTPPGRALEFPAATAIRFFEHHGMLGFRRFPWLTVTGGSRAYVDALAERLGPRLHTGLGVRELRRGTGEVELRTDDGEARTFHRVVVATHADDALGLLADPSEEERRVLGSFAYTRNEAVLHTDSSLLPRAPVARASWNYLLRDGDRPTVTYWLNRLQGLETERDYCVTLNSLEVAGEHVLGRFAYAHPLYTAETPAAQAALRRLSGERRTHYAGAHLGNGFHEAGLASGIDVGRALGVAW